MLTLERARAALNKQDLSTDDQLVKWVNAIVAEMEQYCNQPLVTRTVTLERNYDSKQVYRYMPQTDQLGVLNTYKGIYADGVVELARSLVPLPFLVVPITLVDAAYRNTVFDSYTTVTDISVVTYNGAYHMARRDGFASRGWKVNISAGYSQTKNSDGYVTATTAPEELQQLAIEMLQVRFQRDITGKNTLGLSSVAITQNGTTVNTAYKDMKPEWCDTLDNYRVRIS